MEIEFRDKCEVCGDPLQLTACAGCARRDYEGMREMQAKYIKADHDKRALELQVEELQKELTDLKKGAAHIQDCHDRDMKHLVERTRERDDALRQIEELKKPCCFHACRKGDFGV